MVLYCPKCGKEVSEEANYCPYCGSPVKVTPIGKSGFPIASGVLTIIAACICVFLGIIGFSTVYSYYGIRYNMLVMGIFNIIGFAFGLTSGILNLKRKSFSLAVIGICLVMLSGFIMIVAMAVEPYGGYIAGLIFGVPIVVLSILATIFTAISRQEFT